MDDRCPRCHWRLGEDTVAVSRSGTAAQLDELRAEVERLTAENKRLTTLAANNSAWRAARDQARDDAKRLRAELAKAQHAVSGCCPQSEALAREVERLSEDRDDWLIKAERLRGAVKEAVLLVAIARDYATGDLVTICDRWLAEHGKEAGDG